MSRPLREIATYLAIVFSLAIGIAVALADPGIAVLISAMFPILAVGDHHLRGDASRSPPRAVGQASGWKQVRRVRPGR